MSSSSLLPMMLITKPVPVFFLFHWWIGFSFGKSLGFNYYQNERVKNYSLSLNSDRLNLQKKLKIPLLATTS